MSEAHYIGPIAIVMGTAVVISWLFRVLRLPSVVGFLITGIAIGPSAWQLIPREGVTLFSEFGLILLLFTVGLELSPKSLVKSGRNLLVAAGLQVGGTMLLSVLILQAFFFTGTGANLMVGLAIALSSSAIVLKQMSDRGETAGTTGNITTGLLLLQDVLVIAVLLGVSLVFERKQSDWQEVVIHSAGGLLGMVFIIVLARRYLAGVLSQVSRHGGRELLTLFALLLASGGAWLATVVGWSPALGACIAGLLLAGADERHQLVAEITPFRDVFNALFFISLGMSVTLPVVLNHLPLLGCAIAATLLLKSLVASWAICRAGWPARIGIQVGIGLCTVSEFSYVLLLQGFSLGLIPADTLELMVAYAVGTMMTGALLYPLRGPVSEWLADRLPGRAVPRDAVTGEEPSFNLKNHVIIVGYGTTGKNLARMLTATHVPHCTVEMNQSLIQQARSSGEEVVYGDATRLSILNHAGIETASVLVVAANDKHAAQRIVAQVRFHRPDLYILVRTSLLSEMDGLYQRGASLVIPEDLETSIEVAAHVLRRYGIPNNLTEAQIAAIRVGGYAMLRGQSTTRAAQLELIKIFERTTTQTFYLGDDSYACGHTLGEINLRSVTGCIILAVVRAAIPVTNPGPEYALKSNDVLVLVGAHQQIDAAKALLQYNKVAGPPAVEASGLTPESAPAKTQPPGAAP